MTIVFPLTNHHPPPVPLLPPEIQPLRFSPITSSRTSLVCWRGEGLMAAMELAHDGVGAETADLLCQLKQGLLSPELGPKKEPAAAKRYAEI